MSKVVWKTKVKAAIQKEALDYLNSEARKLSKMKDCKYSKLELQDYLKTPTITTSRKILLYKLRNRMVPNIGHNFGQRIPCKICDTDEDDQQHVFMKCVILKIRCPELLSNTWKYEDIFSDNVAKMTEISEIFEKVLREREIILHQL